VKIGDIILIPFPFAEMADKKVRPAVVVAVTKDKFKDIIVCAISSVLPTKISENEMIIKPQNVNNLRVQSVVKVDRIVTLPRKDIIHELGKLSVTELKKFREIFCNLVN
jgi:mRNA interferase MazF